MLIQKDIDLAQPLTKSQKDILDSMESIPISTDSDCPELSPDQLQKMYKAAIDRKKK